MEVAIQNIVDFRRLKRLAAVRNHAARIFDVDVPHAHRVWLAESAEAHNLPDGALEVVYLTERYCRRCIWRLGEWIVVWFAWLFGLLQYSWRFDFSVGLCQVRVSAWQTAKGLSQAPKWRELRQLMGPRENIRACALVLSHELSLEADSTARALALNLRERHFGFPSMFPGDCVGLGELLEELIRLQREREPPNKRMEPARDAFFPRGYSSG